MRRSHAMGELDRLRRSGMILANCTSFEIGGEAREYYVPGDTEELQQVCRLLSQEGRRPHILGGGCNTLFPDGPFRRPLISTEGLRRLEVAGRGIIAGTGVRMHVLIRTANEAGLGGLEHFIGIPGTVGGAVWMNAGGGGNSFGDRVARIEAVEVATGELRILEGSEIRWDYRTSHLDGLALASVELLLESAEPSVLRQKAKDHLRRKAANQPLQQPSAGCVFKNTPAGPAGVLIEKAGLKGVREGGAVVSQCHANFILNETGSASAQDVMTLVDRVRRRVEEVFGVRLETEIVIPENEPPASASVDPKP